MNTGVPLFLALLLNSAGTYIFRTPKTSDEFPYISYLIFLLSVAFLLWDVKVFSSYYKRLYSGIRLVIEFLVLLFLMEFIANDFWFPLETYVLSLLPKLSELLETLTKSGGIQCSLFCNIKDMLKLPITHVIASYILSTFFLTCTLYATKTLNIKLLYECGVGTFINDTTKRVKNQVYRMFNICENRSGGGKKQVCFMAKSKQKPKCKPNRRYKRECQNWPEETDSEDYCSCECSSRSCSRF